MKVVLYSECCVRAGQPVPVSEINESDWSDDHVLYEGTNEELLDEAEALERDKPNLYRILSARNIRRAVRFKNGGITLTGE